MANRFNMSLQKERKRVKMRTRISLLILLVVILQLVVSTAVLILGGEFRDLKEYSYNSLVEKTKNSGTYIQDELQEKAVVVQEFANQLGGVTAAILEERGESIAELKTDKELSNSIIEASVGIVSGLLESASVNDAYIILETGDLYADEGGDNAKAALYLRNEGPNSDSSNGNLMMVVGFDSISRNFAVARHSDWAQFLTLDPLDSTGSDFYFTTIQTAQENSNLSQNDLGYWSRFSRALPTAAQSMKYSLPLTYEDGTVYGVIGVGLTEDTVLSGIPSYGLSGETACYVLGYGSTGNKYDILTYSGSDYFSLLGGAGALYVSDKEGEGIYNFDMVTDVELSGSVQYLELYNSTSPYANEQWALISVADRSSVLQPLLYLRRRLVTAAMLSLIVAVIVAVLGCRAIVKPLSNLVKQMKVKRKYNEVVRFQPSNVYEINEITDAITQMQINVHGFSSQVSKMISIADVGLGTFMYDRTDDSVFVGQSLITVLGLDLPQGEDIVMGRQEFLNSINNPEIQSPIMAGLDVPYGKMREDFSEVHQVNQLNGNTLWMRLGYTYSPNTVIGIVQDITNTVKEKNRIEYERDHDHLTGLLNRQAYYRRIEKLFHDKSKLNITAFVMVDLDNLKYVNDTYGHNFGDDYIKTAATSLKKFHDCGGIVSRLSGDEFSICLPGFSSKDEVREIVANVRDELLRGSCLLADGTHFKVSGSMGVSWYPDDSDSRELLMKYADFAMYTIKHSTKGGIAEFDRDTYLADSVLLTGVEEMNRVIEESSVKYAFQSIVSAKTGEIYGYEALMRVQSDVFQSPLELLRTAKTGAKLHDIERMTWMKSMENFQTLIDEGRVEKTARLFINSIANNKLEPEVEAILEEKYPHMLEQVVIEILENESANEACSAHKAQLMQKWGGNFALDDFGTGYNSEYALLTLRPNIIKIDRSIVSGCDQDADRRMIIENLIKLARAKGILVLAEGVETEEELKTVVSCGVDLLQGFYLARPLFAPEPIDPAIADMIRRLAGQDGASESRN